MNLILRTTRNARIPTVQNTVPVPLRPSTSDCTVLIWYGQYPSIARTIYGRTRIRVRCSALLLTVLVLLRPLSPNKHQSPVQQPIEYTYTHGRNLTIWLNVSPLEGRLDQSTNIQGTVQYSHTSLAALTLNTPYAMASIPPNTIAVLLFQFAGRVHQPPSARSFKVLHRTQHHIPDGVQTCLG